ncbi:hypothetical protein UFOVP1346_39 [uncultured Caudovirales phage]|uniref:Uncharacterized protein n=1 Tax=uncultured Caudovirales phage TaxID=2100421 RepID=A0A6J5RSP5_9CAUD|nr:hypothetical protein UFOVP921_19 [uncultured Caudovirales phage]CAB4187728.1 hypothetical protein UFOVP1156_55 [uncultured Caudovirales phage]CAB4200413.1 hypothetical protein UFOVP1346_39 [uncultured Caudovirales phage]
MGDRMSRLWAALAGSDGSYPFVTDHKEVMVPSLVEWKFDRWAAKYSFGPVAMQDGVLGDSGVVWVQATSNRILDQIRKFYCPPTVLYTKGARGVALWAVFPISWSQTWDVNSRLARLFGCRIKDANPETFRMTVVGHKAEWRTDTFYSDANDLVRFV